MKLNYILITIIFITILTGCTTDEMTPPPSSFVDRTMTDYSFSDLMSNCTTYNNINITDNISICAPNKQAFIYHTEEHNWSIRCCNFNDKCEFDYNSEKNNLCENISLENYAGNVYNDDGFWMAQCCDDNGQNCFVDLSINVSNDSTICDEVYHHNLYGVNYNGTVWNSMCCIGGIEE